MLGKRGCHRITFCAEYYYYLFLTIYSTKQLEDFIDIILIISSWWYGKAVLFTGPLWVEFIDHWYSFVKNLLNRQLSFVYLRRHDAHVTVMMLPSYLCVRWILPGPAWWPEAGENWTRHIGPGGRSGRTFPERIVIHYTFHHWNVNVVILMNFSSLAAMYVVILTTSDAANNENFVKNDNIFVSVIPPGGYFPTYSQKTPHSSPEMVSYDVSVFPSQCYFGTRSRASIHVYQHGVVRYPHISFTWNTRGVWPFHGTCASHRVGAISISICFF